MIILFAFIILFSYNASALTMKENTVLNQGNINYIFENELVVDSFNLISNGIEINNDRLIFIPEGGKVNIYFYSWSDANKSIGIKSSVPQEITFKITINSQKQYLYDGNTYYVDKYNIGTDLDTLYVIQLGESEVEDYIETSVKKLNWYQQKIFEIELSQEKNEYGVIKGHNFAITYLSFIIFIISVLFLWVIIWRIF